MVAFNDVSPMEAKKIDLLIGRWWNKGEIGHIFW